MSAKDKTTENLVGCMAALILTPFMIALRGWVIATLWRWLIVPTFSLHVLSIWQAIGLSVMVGVLTMGVPDADDDSVLETTLRIVAYTVVAYAISLALGWIVANQI